MLTAATYILAAYAFILLFVWGWFYVGAEPRHDPLQDYSEGRPFGRADGAGRTTARPVDFSPSHAFEVGDV